MKLKAYILLATSILFSTPAASASAIEGTEIGQFAPQGYIGALANQLSITEAHLECSQNDSTQTYIESDSDQFASYKLCMSKYVPFKNLNLEKLDTCPETVVTWGACSAQVGATPYAATVSVKNEIDSGNYEGSAVLFCGKSGSYTVQSGGCARAVKECNAGQLVEWPVTSPVWAQASPEYTYTDKYGRPRNLPKGSCKARMGYAFSGEIAMTYITSPETNFSRYEPTSKTQRRCFDQAWLDEDNKGSLSSCDYIPRSCAAKQVTANGCNFNIPALSHDQIFKGSPSSPAKSTGSVEAYCFDGVVEIIEATCDKSCDPNVASRNWTAGNSLGGKICKHEAFTNGSRIPSGVSVVGENITTGLIGYLEHTCSDGTLSVTGEQCIPDSCQGLNPLSWGAGGMCTHTAITGLDLSDGDTYEVGATQNIFQSQGSVKYECSFGEMKVVSSTCNAVNVQYCTDASIDPEGASCDIASGKEFTVDGKCCKMQGNTLKCRG
jgi:hypothetical protein